MNKKVLFEGLDGKLNVMIPCECGLTLHQIILKDLPRKSNNDLVNYKIVDDLNIDTDFFDAYVFDLNEGSKFVPELAKEIWKNKWRVAREALFPSLDKEFIIALENNNEQEKNKIVETKKALRDITKIEILGNTPEEIKSVWPSILGPKL